VIGDDQVRVIYPRRVAPRRPATVYGIGQFDVVLLRILDMHEVALSAGGRVTETRPDAEVVGQSCEHSPDEGLWHSSPAVGDSVTAVKRISAG
jgi:hypothetical protein